MRDNYDNTACSCRKGRLTQQTNPNGTKTLLTYDNLGEEIERQHETSSGTNLSSVTVGLAVSGLTNSLTRTDGASTFYTKNQTYDPFGELTQESNTDSGGVSHVITYQYDKNGNRTQRHETQAGTALTEDDPSYDTGNRLSSITHWAWSGGTWTSISESFTSAFDANGNETRPSGTFSGTSAYSLSFYPDNLLKTLTGSGNTETSSYDGAGRLSARGGLTFGYDGSSPIVDRNSTNATTERVTGKVADLEIDYSAGSPAIQTLHHDALGNTEIATNGSGTVTATYNAGLFGEGASPSTSEYNFLGGLSYRYRSNGGVYQVGARTYDPLQGRFLQQDPLSFGEADYVYANSDPANEVDPTGFMRVTPQGNGSNGGGGFPRPWQPPQFENCLAFYQYALERNQQAYQQCVQNPFSRLSGNCKVELLISNWAAYAAYVQCFLGW